MSRRSRRAPTICLNMIVRDEAHIVSETLASVAPHIDTWVVVDTGSQDATADVVRRFFAERGIRGELHQRPWRDFGSNRTEALQLCHGKADYAWVIDADDLVIGDLDLTQLTADAYLLRYGSDVRYWRTQLFRTRLAWEWVGVLHEYPRCRTGATEAQLDGPYHIESRRLGARSRTPDRYRQDARLLEEALRADPDNQRHAFYLAQSLWDAGDVAEAVEAWGRRAAMGGWTEEVCFALLRRAQGLERMGEPWPAILAAYLEAFQARPQRAEALVELARACRLSGRYALGYLFARQASAIAFPEHDRLFVALDAYRWRARDEQALCAYYSGRPGESFDLCTELLKQDALPEAERERVMANRDFCVAAVKDVTLAYPSDAVRRLTRQVKRRRGRPQITLSITSCRRRPLFEKTLDSFLSCCEDGDRIGRWLCVDDGSCEADRARMQERYPFFEFVMKSPGEKGHARSMNLILERLESPYWLHLEDDWHFFVGERYVLKSLAVLDDDPRIGQVLFNRNYGETTACRTIAGGQVCRTRRSGERYRRHQHVAPGTEDWRRLLGDMPPGSRTNAWWPHYSLRPALARTAAIRDVGGFSESADHFELEFARRYTARGWTSAFLDAIHCLHIGRLTSEPPGSGPPNAYALNGEPQFGRPPEGPEPAP